MSNDEFLALIFKRRLPTEHLFTASVPGDPTTSRSYGFTPFLDPQANNFFCISTLTDPQHRTPGNCNALFVAVVDDVGTKIKPGRVGELLGDPSYVLETSEGNFQWGYVLDPPCRDQSVAEGIVRGLVTVFTGDMAGRNRLARLPVGTNGKPGKNLWPTKVTFLTENRFNPDDFLTKLGATPVPPTELIAQPALPPDRDPVLRAFEAIHHNYEATRHPNTYKITCPWVEEHTGGRDDGTVYLAPAGFKCHHGHCATKTFADLRKWLNLSAEDIDYAIAEAALTMEKAPTNLSEKPIEQKPAIDPNPHPWDNAFVNDLYHEDNTPLSAEEVAILSPRKWLFENMVPLGVPWGIAGEGGLGKSRLGLALCMSVASGIPFGDFVPANKEGALVVFLTQEDTYPDRNHRYQSQLEFMAEADPRWHSPEVGARLKKNLMVPTLKYGQTLTKTFIQMCQEAWSKFGNPLLVVFDPLILFWDRESSDEDVTSASGTISTITAMNAAVVCAMNPEDWSIGLLHHVTKEGKVYGSVMITAHLRVVFGMYPIEPTDSGGGQAVLKVLKVNASNIKGREWRYDMHPVTGAIRPLEAFGHLTNEQKLARALHSGLLKWDQRPAELVKQAATLDMFGADPAKVVKGVLEDWKTELPVSLGLTRLPYNRYQPIAGWEIAEEA